jgi:hypothetical protein
MGVPQHGIRAERLAEMVALLSGEDAADSADMTRSLLARGCRATEPLQIVARAILDLRESGRALRVTRYLDSSFEPVIDLRGPEPRVVSLFADVDARFRRPGRAVGNPPPRVGDRPAGTTSGFVPA